MIRRSSKTSESRSAGPGGSLSPAEAPTEPAPALWAPGAEAYVAGLLGSEQDHWEREARQYLDGMFGVGQRPSRETGR
jgi:hypothetical protein